jgi:hypothetical protein
MALDRQCLGSRAFSFLSSVFGNVAPGSDDRPRDFEDRQTVLGATGDGLGSPVSSDLGFSL